MRQNDPEHVLNLNVIRIGPAQTEVKSTPAGHAQDAALNRALQSVNTRVQSVWPPPRFQ